MTSPTEGGGGHRLAVQFLRAVTDRDDPRAWALAQEVARTARADAERTRRSALQVLEGGLSAISGGAAGATRRAAGGRRRMGVGIGVGGATK